MATRKPTFRTGTPAIQPARALDLRTLQQAIDNIRERFLNAEAQITFLQQVADANVDTGDLTLMQQQIAGLTTSLNVLAARLAAVPSSTSSAPAYVLLDMSEHTEETIIIRN